MNFILHLVGSKIHNDLYTLSYTYVDIMYTYIITAVDKQDNGSFTII